MADSVMDIVGIIADIASCFLAFIATAIAIIEYKRLKRDEKADERRRIILRELCEDFKGLEGLMNFCDKYDSAKKEDERRRAQDMEKRATDCGIGSAIDALTTVWGVDVNIEHAESDAVKLGQYKRLRAFAYSYERWCLIEGSKVFDIIEKAYKTFLRYEERFSLSYGYDRFINAFRGMVLLKGEYERIDATTSAEDAEKICERVYFEMKKITPYIREVQIKCEAMSNELKTSP